MGRRNPLKQLENVVRRGAGAIGSTIGTGVGFIVGGPVGAGIGASIGGQVGGVAEKRESEADARREEGRAEREADRLANEPQTTVKNPTQSSNIDSGLSDVGFGDISSIFKEDEETDPFKRLIL